MAQALEDLGEAGESIGTLLLPVLASVAQGLAGLARLCCRSHATIQAAIAPVIAFITSLFSGAGGKLGGLQDIFAGLVASGSSQCANHHVRGRTGVRCYWLMSSKSVMPIILIELAKVVLPHPGSGSYSPVQCTGHCIQGHWRCL